MQVTFTDMLRGQNARSKMGLSYLGVRKKVSNQCLRFQGFKGKETLTLDVFKGYKLHVTQKCGTQRLKSKTQSTNDLLGG